MTAQKKFDVGIVGLGLGANYGSVLTYYSLYKAIEACGKSVLMVSKIGARADDPELKNTHAVRFARENYNLSDVYSQETVPELNNIVDTFVVGSDQVWNHGVSRNFGKALYLDFALDSKRKISYAASFGHAKDFAPENEVAAISDLMKRFQAISVREDSGVSLARDVYGVSATQVADPIFLTSAEAYLSLASKSRQDLSQPYVLAYILDPTPEKKAAIEHIARKLGVGIRVMLDGFPHLFEENKRSMDLEKYTEDNVDAYYFLRLFANASYVITDSFHGTAFSLRFQKNFAAIGNKRRGMARFDSLLRLIGDRSHFTMDASQIIKEDVRFLEPLEYKRINAILDQHIAESKSWLEAALDMPTKYSIGHPASPIRLKRNIFASAARRVENGMRQAYYAIERGVGFRPITIKGPSFKSNNAAWRIASQKKTTRIQVASPESAAKGNHVWCDASTKFNENVAYEIALNWTLRTSASAVNLHLRNAKTGSFKVIGAIPTERKAGARIDKIKFIAPKGEFSQIMFGAVHFTGPNAGADIDSIAVRKISRDDVLAAKYPEFKAVSKKSPAEVARDLSERDISRFVRFYAQKMVARSEGNARALLMFHSHGLEKGLSRNKGFRPGFGEAAITPLAREMNAWLAKGRNCEDTFFKVAASVMQVYFARHRALGVDVEKFWNLFDKDVQNLIDDAAPDYGGAAPADNVRERLPHAQQLTSFLEIVYGRRSVRDFNDDPVSDGDIRTAVEIAMQAPSVCNRQSVRVHYFEDKELMRAALDLQGGFRGYAMPPRLLLVTSDLSAFLFAVERNQAFIDGGLFLMNLLLGLQQVGLGSCCLNTAMDGQREDAIRKMLKIPESEVFISFVAVGHYEASDLTPRSKRVELDAVLVPHNRI
ncbi:polysaccharide pyruvyl transferase family protein [Cereibacter sphaeroides]|uniref:polysaccharide pyruvyl transferase family protein n=1 Tax=Cereibacter sphaeroides TaxID=1063 RepID=UPI001F247378|nr:polysaccharide pyruvyl transferase family protein [Cereibacter sphaeroides]MCE6958700.1 polysaccharide pyruvyl transferase family protein [Cereibacter sphaeroides]MCE6973417.1 polysaccharide pyruvyl transferase family protein [Cereibacter sphaeroides]